MLKAKLVVVGGDAQQAEIELRLPLVIGRGRDVGLTVPHALVSRRHSEIIERNGHLVVRDLGSLNGTFINNQRIESEQTLEPDQLLTLGNITFRAVYQIDQQIEQTALAGSLEAAPIGANPTASGGVAIEPESGKGRAGAAGSPGISHQHETIPVDRYDAEPDAETLPQDRITDRDSARQNSSAAQASTTDSEDLEIMEEAEILEEVVFEHLESIEPGTPDADDLLVDLGLDDDDDDDFRGKPNDPVKESFLRNLPR